ncbi:hypothetical protein SAMN05421780_101718 [Flexibacter flexilis DSM 6793]|uniref:Uncharacterized protein n=1 Tax=Flexibacter flexilis DSM 6793 TaxID=927664 RepID=A0A1I1EAK5_9BACT|nr:hypothetical protein [Flexibacter flexilis]SFB84135.1 hypothetical protein SAMN05421780_101718 [Flexibacter flexilis DSM 6793]
MQKGKEPTQPMVSIPEKALLRMVLRVTQGRNLFPEKVEDAKRVLQGATFKTPLK